MTSLPPEVQSQLHALNRWANERPQVISLLYDMGWMPEQLNDPDDKLRLGILLDRLKNHSEGVLDLLRGWD